MALLLANDAPGSEHEPDLTAAAAARVPLAMHPVTGAFAGC